MALDVATLGVKVDTTDLKRGGAELDKFSTKGARAEQSFQRVGTATAQAGRQFAASSNSLRMASMQLSQVAQQGAATGNFVQALAIQLPDLGLAFGTVGIAAGVVGGMLLPLAADLVGVGDAAEDLSEIIDNLESSAARFGRLVKQGGLGADELVTKYGAAADAARRLLDNRIEHERFEIGLEMADAISALTAGMGDLGAVSEENFARIVDVGDLIRTTYAEMLEAQRTGDTERLAALQAEVIALGQLPDMVSDLATEYGVTREAAQGLLTASRELQTATTFNEQAEAAATLAQEIWDAYGSVSEMPEPVREIWKGLNQAGLAAAQLEGSTMADPVVAAAKAASEFSQDLWDAVSAANQLKGLGVSGGRGGDPRQFEDDPYWRNKYFPDPERPNRPKKKRGGGGHLSELERQARALVRATRTADEYHAILAELDDMLDSGEITMSQYTDAVDRLDDRFKDVSGTAGEFKAITDLTKDAVLEFAMEGESALDSLARAIQRAALEAMLFGEGPLGGIFGDVFGESGIIGSIFDGFRASGGPVNAGGAYVVGERGPEVFSPSSNGTIIPNHALGGSSAVNLIVNVENTVPGSEVEVSQRPDGRIDIQVAEAMGDAFRSGRMNGVMRQQFGLRPKSMGG